jgi:hypothetical protein
MTTLSRAPFPPPPLIDKSDFGALAVMDQDYLDEHMHHVLGLQVLAWGGYRMPERETAKESGL